MNIHLAVEDRDCRNIRRGNRKAEAPLPIDGAWWTEPSEIKETRRAIAIRC